jgi:putative flippase GtrA
VFCFIGAFVFLVGLAIQWVLIHLGFGATLSYVLRGVVTIELSFALNRVLTWRDRHVDLIGALVKWNAQKLLMAAPDAGAYALLVWLGMNWLTANIVITGVFSVINYASGHLWSFRVIHMPKHRRTSQQRATASSPAPRRRPT